MYANAPENRTIFVGWMNNWAYAPALQRKGRHPAFQFWGGSCSDGRSVGNLAEYLAAESGLGG
jgi:hypothetical protein